MAIIFKVSFLWTHLKLSHLAHGDACIYAHIAYYIVPLWFWLIVWGEFLMRVLDWNVKTINQWQIAWTKLWKLLELTFAGTLVGELMSAFGYRVVIMGWWYISLVFQAPLLETTIYTQRLNFYPLHHVVFSGSETFWL